MRSIARIGIGLAVLLISFMVVPSPSFAGWERASKTAVNIKKVCRDAIRFDGGVVNGEGPDGDYRSFAVVTDPPPTSDPVPADTVVIRTKIRIPKLDNPKEVPLPGEKLKVSHLRSFEMRFYDDLKAGDTVALNIQDFDGGLSFSTKKVENCRMFG